MGRRQVEIRRGGEIGKRGDLTGMGRDGKGRGGEKWVEIRRGGVEMERRHIRLRWGNRKGRGGDARRGRWERNEGWG